MPKIFSIAAFQNDDMGTPNYVFNFFINAIVSLLTGLLLKTGKIINLDFTTGLNAPKGLGRFGNELYAADLSEVVVIDINTGKVKIK